MTFFSVSFFIFLTVLLVLYSFFRKEKQRQYILLATSLLFYATWGWQSFILICVCMIIIHFSAQSLFARQTRFRLLVPVCLLLIILCLYKYAAVSPMLPAGISFYMFSAIGYLIDIYRGKIKEKPTLVQEALYVLFFPKILQGPLVKATTFFEQIKQPHSVSRKNVIAGIEIFLTGLVKKIVIADRLGLFVNAVYDSPDVYNGATLLLAVISYTIQLYCDFSGYTDMAVGTARMLGYEMVPNFNLPFLSKNVAEYWRRWHISLNIWFRDYIYIPLGGNRCGMMRHCFNVFVTFLISGLWHGNTVNFVLWGAIYGLLMSFSLITRNLRIKKDTKVLDILRIIRTYIITVFMYIPFRAPDLKTCMVIIAGIFKWQEGVRYYYTWSFIYIPLVWCACIYAYKKNNGNSFYINLDLSKFKNMLILWMVLFLTIALMYIGENYFMYLQF